MTNTDKQLSTSANNKPMGIGKPHSAVKAPSTQQEDGTVSKHDIDLFDELTNAESWAEPVSETGNRKIKVNGLNRREIEKRAEEKRLKRLLDDLDFNYEDL